MPIQQKVNQGISDISQRLSIPMVATNDCHYLAKEDKKAHDILLCIQTGDTVSNQNRFKFDSDQLYFKSSDEMIATLGQYAGAIENTKDVAARCNVEFDDKTYHFPRYAQSDEDSEAELFKQKAMAGFEEKLAIIKKRIPMSMNRNTGTASPMRSRLSWTWGFPDISLLSRISLPMPGKSGSR